jgi:PAS domain S-box-containing protein
VVKLHYRQIVVHSGAQPLDSSRKMCYTRAIQTSVVSQRGCVTPTAANDDRSASSQLSALPAGATPPDELGMRRLAAVAELGQRALATRDLHILLEHAVALVARTLGVDYCSVLQVQPNGSDLLCIAGLGWPDGVIGRAIVPGGLRSQAGYTLASGTSVVMEDLHSETRFAGHQLLREHGVVSGASVIIAGSAQPFGVLSVHTRTARQFLIEDVHFLEASANVLTSAIERAETDARLRETEAQYRSIFEATTDGLVIIDLNGTIAEINPAYCSMLGYTYAELLGRSYRSLFHPESHQLAGEAFATILAGGTVRTEAILVHKNGTPIHVEGHGTSFTYMGKQHLLGVARNITERVQAYELLEQRVAERTRELSAILEVSHNVASTLELAPLLGLILDQLKRVVDYTGAAIFTIEEEQARVVDYRGPLARHEVLTVRVPSNRALGYQAVSYAKGPVIVDDAWHTHPLAPQIGDLRAYFSAMVSYARSWLVVPLMIQERVFGVVRIDHAAAYAYTPHHAALAMAFATHVAIALENARLYEQAREAAAMQERYRLARELHDSVTQALYGVTMYAEASTALLAANDYATAANYLSVLRDTAQDALREMRLLS